MQQFAIYALPVNGGGQLALCPLPGRGGAYRDDLARIVAWRPDLVLGMTEASEMSGGGAAGLSADLQQSGIAWTHLPIRDFGAPQGQTLADWPGAARDACAILRRGGRVLAHCFGGQGRSGMAVLRLLVELGEPPDQALARLRQIRPGAVETDAQYAWAASAVRHPG